MVVVVDNLGKRYGRATALDGVSFEVGVDQFPR